MQRNVSALWRRLPSDLNTRIEKCIRSGGEKAEGRGGGYLFFRADDVAVPGRQFSRMMDLFSTYGVPLSLAVVPAMLTRKRWQYLKGFEKKNPSRWCWHQHGWRHVNHETEGKKQEFGGARTISEIQRDLVGGKKPPRAAHGRSVLSGVYPPVESLQQRYPEIIEGAGLCGCFPQPREQDAVPPGVA